MNGRGLQMVTDAGARFLLQHSDALLGALIENAFELVVIVSPDGLVRYANRSTERMLGYQPSLLVGASLVSMIHPDDAMQASGTLAMFLDGNSGIESPSVIMEARFGHINGSWTVLECIVNALDSQVAAGIVMRSRDITDRRRNLEVLAGELRILEMIGRGASLQDALISVAELIDSNAVGLQCAILLLDEDGVHARHGASPALSDEYMLAVDGLEIGAGLPASGVDGEGRKTFMLTDIRQDSHWNEYGELIRKLGFSGSWIAPIFSSSGTVLGLIGLHSRTQHSLVPDELKLAEEVTRIAGLAIERKHSETKVNHLAYHDALTGLPNRILLQDRLTQAIIHADRIKDGGAVLFVDLDHFKQVNDTYGHATGDRVLQDVAQRLQKCMRREDSLGRLGGDEFVLTLMPPADSRSAAQVAQKIIDALNVPVMQDALAINMSCSIGISMYPGDGDSAETLMRNADIAMYRAKQEGRGNFRYFTPDLNAQAQNRSLMANQLRQALGQGEFSLEYQSEVDMATGLIFAVEALLRWHQPERGLVAPHEFIPIAEDIGLIASIGDWVLREACIQLKCWHDAGHVNLGLSLNLSSRQLLQTDIASVITCILNQTGVPPDALTLEIKEEILNFPAHEKLTMLKHLNGVGVHLSLDNFGTGYSSLADLQRLSLTSLKIDQSFIQGIGRSPEDTALTNAIIAMARELHLNVTAAGVESAVQASFLKQHGCRRGQGNFYGQAVTGAVMTEILRARSA